MRRAALARAPVGDVDETELRVRVRTPMKGCIQVAFAGAQELRRPLPATDEQLLAGRSPPLRRRRRPLPAALRVGAPVRKRRAARLRPGPSPRLDREACGTAASGAPRTRDIR